MWSLCVGGGRRRRSNYRLGMYSGIILTILALIMTSAVVNGGVNGGVVL